MLKILKRIPAAVILTIALIFTQCMASQIQTKNPPPVFESADFTEDHSAIINPERGWYRSMETPDADMGNLEEFAEDNITLVALEVYIGDFTTGPIGAAKLNEIDDAFNNAREAGLSVIFRAAYDFDGKNRPDPADIQIVLNHIKQLGLIFQKHEDVLFNIQAGFLGPWGEWHSSRYSPGGKQDEAVEPQYQRLIVKALLEAVPESVSIGLRRPEYIRNIADENAKNNARGNHSPVTQTEAFGNSTIARLAFHNDALMSEATDMDTYIDPNYSREEELAWINKHTRFTPFIGETNKVSRYNDTPNAVPFLDLMNAHSLNIEYHPNVLKKWKTTNYNGVNAYDYITNMLGYRFVLKQARIPREVPAGGVLSLNLELMNTGFGHLLREKKFEILLKNGSQLIRARINEDARFWNKNELISRVYNFSLPSDISAGDWDVYLGLTSTFETLADNPAYSVRFANLDVWNEELGLNKIGSVRITGVEENVDTEEFAQINP